MMLISLMLFSPEAAEAGGGLVMPAPVSEEQKWMRVREGMYRAREMLRKCFDNMLMMCQTLGQPEY